MSDFYDKFEQRFTNEWFSSGWAEVENKKTEIHKPERKSLEMLEMELNALKENMLSIEQRQLRLSNLARFYQN